MEKKQWQKKVENYSRENSKIKKKKGDETTSSIGIIAKCKNDNSGRQKKERERSKEYIYHRGSSRSMGREMCSRGKWCQIDTNLDRKRAQGHYPDQWRFTPRTRSQNMEVSRGGSSLIRGSYRKPAREGGAHNNENDEEKMVVTQRAECAHSGTRGENSGENNHQVCDEDTSHYLPALGPSGRSEPDPQNANDPLQSPVMDLPKCEEAKSASKVLVATDRKSVV